MTLIPHADSRNSSSSVAVKALCVSTPHTAAQGVSGDESKFSCPPPSCGGVEERCKMALQHVALGLECLQYFDNSDKDSRQEGVDEKSAYQVRVNAAALNARVVYVEWKHNVGCARAFWVRETAERTLTKIGVATPSNAVGSVSFWFSWFALLTWLRMGTGCGEL